MRSTLTLATGTFLILPTLLIVISCNSVGENKSTEADMNQLDINSYYVTRANIDRLRLGMTIEEAGNILAPATPTPASVPALLYRTLDGGIYYLVFYDDDIDNDTHVHDEIPALKYVVFFNDDKYKDGRYVLPKAKKGQSFKFGHECGVNDK